jgi:hypothetical protein
MAEAEGQSRRSKIVTVSVVGLVGAVWLGDELIPREVEMRRNLYGDRVTCERDYSPSQCEQTISSNSGGAGHGGGGYHGPVYAASRGEAAAGDPGSGRSGVTPALFQISYRGGFGAFGHAVRGGS